MTLFKHLAQEGWHLPSGPRKVDHQCWSLPEGEGFLLDPWERLDGKLDVEVPEEFGEDETHLGIGETVWDVRFGHAKMVWN